MTLDIRVGPGKALALYLRQLRKRERLDRERDAAERRRAAEARAAQQTVRDVIGLPVDA